MEFSTPVTQLGTVGKTTAKRLKNLGIETAENLLWHLPFRYDDFSKILKIGEISPGESGSIAGTIDLLQNKRSFKKKLFVTEALVSDNTGSIKIIWFNQPYLAKTLTIGDKISLAGKFENEYASIVMLSPIYEKCKPGGQIHTQGLIPVYHLTNNITGKQIRFLISKVIGLTGKMPDWIPKEIINDLQMISLAEALRKIHFPKDKTEIEDAQKRLAFDELFLLQLQAQNIRQRLKAKTAISINFLEKETKKFVDSLPFKLTDAQRKAAWEILRDIARAQPMSRILEGDVGSGKTIVAGIALFNTAMNKRQAVLMAPTEILAIQHYETLIKLFSATPLKIALITANKKISNEIIPEKAKSGNKKSKTPSLPDLIKNSSILVGTHALIQDKINFTDLSLVIVDEQHRFGVKQRQKLTAISANSLNHKDIIPHFLSMTATPIPRSLALAMFGEVDISLINQMPQGRKPILTRVVDEQNRFKAYEFLREKIKDGRQAFVICPLIDPSDKLGIKSVTEEYARLNRDVFPEFTIGLLHGKLKSAEKEKIMEDFKKNKIKILVSTSIVEVGVDIPNASIMMIEGADRFGLAQLHQFRGRVGRGEHQSFCFLFAESNSPKTKERLKALEKYSDGFALSKIDLKFRGPGEIYGTAQSGFPELKIASLFDYALMKKALDWAKKIIENDPKLERYPLIKNKLDTLGDNTHLE